MDLNGVSTFVPIRERDDLARWVPGAAWLGGGTWLFSEPQPGVDTLLDLASLAWPPITLDDEGLHIAATCTFATLAAFSVPPDLLGLGLIEPCCRALLGSFKVWNVATVGGNICLALPAAPMVAFAAALDGVALIWGPDGSERRLPVLDFVVGANATMLKPGEVLRAIDIPASALRRRVAHRRASLTSGGRSAVLLIGTRDAGTFALTITASTPRPVRLAFAETPSAQDLRSMIDAVLPDDAYYDDIHGRPAWRRHLTRVLAEEIRTELFPAS